MSVSGLFRLAAADLRRDLRHYMAAGAGVVVGVAALAFFLALARGVGDVLRGELLPVDVVEVGPRGLELDLFALRLGVGGDTLAGDDLQRLAAVSGVVSVYPKMRLLAPALASGGESLLGTDLQTEIVVDGVAGGALEEGVDRKEFTAPPLGAGCTSDLECGQGLYCSGRPGETVCRAPIPAVISNHLVELYNGAFRRAYDLPRLNPDAVVGLGFDVAFGGSTFRAPGRGGVVRARVRLAGFSDRAIPLGITIPLEEVQRLNGILGPAEASDEYHSALLEVSDPGDLPEVVSSVEQLGLEVRDRGARRAASLLGALVAVAALVAGAILLVAAVSIAHVFLMLVVSREREIGVLRAVGARRGDVVRLLLGQAATVGVGAGMTGVLVARLAAAAADAAASGLLPDFPYKPDTFFAFSPWLVVSAIALGIACCVAGAAWPALRAARHDPVTMLARR